MFITNNIPQTPEIIFSILLIDEKDNFEYFCHKYKVSKKLKKDLSFIANNYIKFKDEKNYLKQDLKKNIYKIGKNKIKKLITFIYCSEKKFSFILFKKIFNEVDNMRVPNFPFNGEYVIGQGLEDGKKIGFALKELEKKAPVARQEKKRDWFGNVWKAKGTKSYTTESWKVRKADCATWKGN